MAILVPCLVALRAEFDAVSPNRDKASDGWIGDAAHRQESSDHNPDETGRTPYEDADNIDEVHAIDVDDSGPWPDAGWFDRTVLAIVERHRTGQDDRLQNVIRNGRIASRSWGWTWRTYDGPNPHTEHAHFSARYSSAQEADTRPWGVDDMSEVVKGIQAACKAAGYDPGPIDGVWGAKTEAALTAALKSVGPRGPAGAQGPPGPAAVLPPRVTFTGDLRAA